MSSCRNTWKQRADLVCRQTRDVPFSLYSQCQYLHHKGKLNTMLHCYESLFYISITIITISLALQKKEEVIWQVKAITCPVCVHVHICGPEWGKPAHLMWTATWFSWSESQNSFKQDQRSDLWTTSELENSIHISLIIPNLGLQWPQFQKKYENDLSQLHFFYKCLLFKFPENIMQMPMFYFLLKKWTS